MTDHSAKTFIVTGANTGVGLETARGLARAGARVVLTVRSAKKGEAALDELRRDTGSDKLSFEILDLGSFGSIEAAAEKLSERCDRIDGLINNAGLGAASEGRTEDGLPLVMGVNYVGPFLLTRRLLPRLLETAREEGQARVVNVSSLAHRFARRFDPENLLPDPRPRARDAYSESKLANLLHARELARRHGGEGLHAHAVHPGFVASDFGRAEHFPGPWQLVFKATRPLQISPAKGARPSLHAALSEEAGRTNGLYWTKATPSDPYLPEDAETVQARLWAETESLIEAERGSASA